MSRLSAVRAARERNFQGHTSCCTQRASAPRCPTMQIRPLEGATRLACLLSILWIAPARAADGLPATGDAVGPTLTEVVRAAEQGAPDILLARAELNVSRSSYVGAQLGPVGNPYLELTAERTFNGAAAPVAMLASIWLPFEVNGQRAKRIAEARAFVGWHRAALAEVRARAVGNAIAAYGAVVTGSAKLRVLENIARTARREAELYRARMAAGDAVQREARLAEAEAARNHALLEQARADLETSLLELNAATGLDVHSVPSGALDAPALDTRPSPRSDPPAVASAAAEIRYHDRASERAAREGFGPVSLIVQAARGEFGEARFGGGVAYTIPAFHRNQGERAQAIALRTRAETALTLRRQAVARRVKAARAELSDVRRAVEVLNTEAIPAEESAVDAAVETQRAGKGDQLTVLVSRRDLGLLYLQRLELLEREWRLVGEIVATTGQSP